MSFTFSAPAKIILLGEHAVVYGQPAIAAPISDLRATATFALNPDSKSGLRIIAEDLNEFIDYQRDLDHVLALTAAKVLHHLQAEPPNVTIRLRSQIPLASGLGSGAAVSTALARALTGAVGRTLSNEALNAIIFEVEKVYHGTPSGIDNTVIVYEQPVYFVRDQALDRIEIGGAFRFLIGDTGQRAITKVAVGDVRRLYENQPQAIQPTLENIGRIVMAARGCIEQAQVNAFGQLMNENQKLLELLTVSSPELEKLIDAARDAGALGAKLSGGGRGGNMIALVPQDREAGIEKAMLKAGAVRVFRTIVQNQRTS
jgi:mevalonate kinase